MDLILEQRQGAQKKNVDGKSLRQSNERKHGGVCANGVTQTDKNVTIAAKTRDAAEAHAHAIAKRQHAPPRSPHHCGWCARAIWRPLAPPWRAGGRHRAFLGAKK